MIELRRQKEEDLVTCYLDIDKSEGDNPDINILAYDKCDRLLKTVAWFSRNDDGKYVLMLRTDLDKKLGFDLDELGQIKVT